MILACTTCGSRLKTAWRRLQCMILGRQTSTASCTGCRQKRSALKRSPSSPSVKCCRLPQKRTPGRSWIWHGKRTSQGGSTPNDKGHTAQGFHRPQGHQTRIWQGGDDFCRAQRLRQVVDNRRDNFCPLWQAHEKVKQEPRKEGCRASHGADALCPKFKGISGDKVTWRLRQPVIFAVCARFRWRQGSEQADSRR